MTTDQQQLVLDLLDSITGAGWSLQECDIIRRVKQLLGHQQVAIIPVEVRKDV